MSNRVISVVILAAGRGTRMYSDLPKVLHTLSGKPLIKYVIDTAKRIGARKINLVYGHEGNQIKTILNNEMINWVLQSEQLGTGHAIQQAIPFICDNEDILVLYGDVPLVTLDTLVRLCAVKPLGGIGLLTVELDNPAGYGRIIRKNGKVTRIVEQKDATPRQLMIREINTGALIANGGDLKRWVSQLMRNEQGEYYITDIINLARDEGRRIETVQPSRIIEIEGVNNRLQLAMLERMYQMEQAEQLLLSGLMLRDPKRFDLRGQLQHGRDVEIDSNVILEGQIKLGNNVSIGVGCVIKNSTIGDGCKISPYSIIEGAELNAFCTVGPFAHLRPGSKLGESVHIGNFVEMKKVNLGKCSKASHLSYLGDAEIGSRVNIGAGTVTCNYDGVNKSKTIIGDDVFIGSNTQLLAPVTIANGATIAAGTTIMKNVTSDELVYNRKEQVQKSGWKRQIKNKIVNPK